MIFTLCFGEQPASIGTRQPLKESPHLLWVGKQVMPFRKARALPFLEERHLGVNSPKILSPRAFRRIPNLTLFEMHEPSPILLHSELTIFSISSYGIG